METLLKFILSFKPVTAETKEVFATVEKLYKDLLRIKERIKNV